MDAEQYIVVYVGIGAHGPKIGPENDPPAAPVRRFGDLGAAIAFGSSANHAPGTPQSPLCRIPVAPGWPGAYIGAIENGGAVRIGRSKMNNLFGRISENVLFAVLITAVVGWTAVSVAADSVVTSSSPSCAVARAAAPVASGLVQAPAAHTRCVG
jgi:hypothetical protein